MVRPYFLGVLLAAMFVPVLSGCSFYSSQARFVKKMMADESDKVAEYAWRVEFNGYSATLYAVAAKHGTVFGNYTGDAVVFDGWTLKEIRGMGRFRYRWVVKSEDDFRMFYEIGKFQGSYRCGSWQVAQSQGEAAQLKQYCRGGQGREYQNRMQLMPDNSVDRIEWGVVGEPGPLVLQRLRQKTPN